jgi:hypothetical protein
MLSHAARRAMYALIALMALAAAVSAGNAKIHWVYETTGGYLDSSPAIADLDGDGSLDICMTSIAGPVFVLDANGRQIWKTDLKERISIAPTAADVTGDPALELLVVTQSGKVYCMEGRSGDIIWIHDIPTGAKLDGVTLHSMLYVPDVPIKHGGTVIVATDINADGNVEIITNTIQGIVVCLDGKGDLLWKYDAGEAMGSTPAVGDLDGDGKAEIVVATYEHPAIALSATGKVLWKHARDKALPGVGRHVNATSPVIADLDGDGKGEVINFDQKTMFALNGDGAVRWTTVASRAKVDATLTVADADRDGSPEIYLVDISGDVVRVNADGKRTWTTNIGARSRRSFSVADVDGDGVIEIAVGSYSGKIAILTPDGKIEETLNIGAGTNATSSVADLVGDKSMCIVTPEITGNLSVYRWERGTVDPAILVPGYRGGNTRTASSFVSKATRTRLFKSLSTGSVYSRKPAFAAKIVNPAKDKLTVALTVADNTRITAKTKKAVSGKSGKVSLRYKGSKLTGDAVFTCTVSNAAGVIEKHTFTQALVPYAATVTGLKKQDARIADLIRQVPDRSGIEERLTWLHVKLPALAKKVNTLSRLSAIQLRELRDDLTTISDDFSALETLANAAVKAGTGVYLSSANPWAPFGGIDELAEGRMGSSTLLVEAFHGEVESAALNVWNFTGTARTLRVTMSGLAGSDTTINDAVTVREVVSVATQMSDMMADALPRMNEARTIVVPAWGARQLWLEIHTKGLSPGEWNGTVSLKDMDVSAEVVSAPVEIAVWPIAQSTKDIFKLCGWTNTRNPGVMKDMLNHGMNVYTNGPSVPFTFDAEGTIVSADFKALDEYMDVHARVGTPLFHSLVRLSGPAEAFTPIWRKAYITAVRQFTAHIIEIGFGYDSYAYYPVDEPGIEEGRNVARFVKHASITHEADPKIRIYTNPSGISKEQLARMMPYADIYAPMHISSWDIDPGSKVRMVEMRADADEMWTYTCAHDAKHLSPLAYYRGQMWMAFTHGHSGGGFYTYSQIPGKFWHMMPGEYALVYLNADGPTPSKRWEAVRDGVEDYSMLMALKTAAAATGADPALVKRARALMSGNAVTIGDYCSNDDDGTKPGKEGLPGVRKIADKRWKTIVASRREMRDLLKAFAK